MLSVLCVGVDESARLTSFCFALFNTQTQLGRVLLSWNHRHRLHCRVTSKEEEKKKKKKVLTFSFMLLWALIKKQSTSFAQTRWCWVECKANYSEWFWDAISCIHEHHRHQITFTITHNIIACSLAKGERGRKFVCVSLCVKNKLKIMRMEIVHSSRHILVRLMGFVCDADTIWFCIIRMHADSRIFPLCEYPIIPYFVPWCQKLPFSCQKRAENCFWHVGNLRVVRWCCYRFPITRKTSNFAFSNFSSSSIALHSRLRGDDDAFSHSIERLQRQRR